MYFWAFCLELCLPSCKLNKIIWYKNTHNCQIQTAAKIWGGYCIICIPKWISTFMVWLVIYSCNLELEYWKLHCHLVISRTIYLKHVMVALVSSFVRKIAQCILTDSAVKLKSITKHCMIHCGFNSVLSSHLCYLDTYVSCCLKSFKSYRQCYRRKIFVPFFKGAFAP